MSKKKTLKSNKKTSLVSKENGLICLRKGLYYDPIKDSYMFTSSDPENFGPISSIVFLISSASSSLLKRPSSKIILSILTKCKSLLIRFEEDKSSISV
jgi:hypothetical protein